MIGIFQLRERKEQLDSKLMKFLVALNEELC
jgi:hypothetical protein